MQDIDDLIRKALCEEDQRWFDQLDEQSLHEMVVASFQGKMRGFVILVYAGIFLAFVIMLLCGYEMLVVEDGRMRHLYSVGFVMAGLVIAMLKIWYWMELNRLAMTREIKRVELQLARLLAHWKSAK